MSEDLGIQTLIEDLRKGGDDRFLEIERVSKHLLIAVCRIRNPYIAGVRYYTHKYALKFLTRFETVATCECTREEFVMYLNIVRSRESGLSQLDHLNEVRKYLKPKHLAKKCKQWDEKFKNTGYNWIELEFYSPPIGL